MDIFIVLTLVMVSHIYIYIYVQLIMHSKCNLLHIDYILIKILK